MREQALEDYRKMTLSDLLKARLYESYVPGVIEQVIFEKVKVLEDLK
jgi:hypothetical protein